MTDSEHPESGVYYEPQERLTRLAEAMTDALTAHPEYGEDIRGAFMLHDDQNGSGAALVGYPEGDELSAEALNDVVTHISNLFRAAGVTLEIRTEMTGEPGGDGPAAGTRDGKRAVLTLTAPVPDERMQAACRAVKEAIEGTSGLSETEVIIVMRLGPESSALMHHGFKNTHQVAHALFDTFQHVVATEGGRVAIIPIMDPGALN